MPTRPDIEQIWQAIETYLRVAYDNDAPTSVRTRLEALRADGQALLDNEMIERNDREHPSRFALRLGNRFYPHMKLVIDCSHDGVCLFRADTHDVHCRPPEGSCEMDAYRDLVNHNRQIASAIEEAWSRQGLQTFKSWLRRDLDRRRTPNSH